MPSAKYISTILLAACLAIPAFAQGGNQGQRREGGRRPGPHFGDWLRNSKNLTAQQKEKALESDPNFQKLPSERQEKLKLRLQQFNSLPADQQQRILQRMETWEHMTPEQHKQARMLLDRIRDYPNDRRMAIRDQIRAFSTMTPEQRQNFMNSDQYHRNYSADERELMQSWMELRDRNTESAAPRLEETPR